ncbi:MAG: dTDP-4-dehydrorhamnose 3,5-epimerase [Candidatus Buchananbacteria bacterium RIFCSPHIGHO2_01_FULL_39_14]|uniref:dTDP-4-dehydrorhamnose 3,5-epimerase n=1 Tax=Candidatus Buchananbacteria bacterium RIFCSPHIGHO2_01_FULL_39_14 TaxID=1797532 RepID=A0A1G1XTM7_9BACT|nr:MAG: dTDP-4-dehydrorhamnose 3,5-epimerase [Candidatus Buchananbacteria bacterium RIFCSPHIGHO2_01_FULL_39_14]OGY49239.1 MAG: dTDP-4-dehydrorhamnose 3,5-epimerase [Candidatus Buchananbacteria bacterium RIFCSPHIGHO2_02_FULL_39_17]
MINGVEVRKLKIYHDTRGWLTEIYRQDETNYRPVMAYLSETKPGVVRGPHEHKNQSDFFVFLAGKFKLYLWENRKNQKNYRKFQTFIVGGKNPCSVLIPPGVVHAYQCVSQPPGLIVNFPNRLFMGKGRKQKVDEIRWEVDLKSPFIVKN